MQAYTVTVFEMSATSSTDVGTPVHISSSSFVSEGVNGRYLTSEEQLDVDEAIDLDDHVTSHECGHVTQRMKLSISDDSNEEASTAEEGIDSVPNYESTTTDNIVDVVEPVDFIEANPKLHPPPQLRYHANGAVLGRHGNEAVPSPPSHRYENWSVVLQLDDGSRKSMFCQSACMQDPQILTVYYTILGLTHINQLIRNHKYFILFHHLTITHTTQTSSNSAELRYPIASL